MLSLVVNLASYQYPPLLSADYHQMLAQEAMEHLHLIKKNLLSLHPILVIVVAGP